MGAVAALWLLAAAAKPLALELAVAKRRLENDDDDVLDDDDTLSRINCRTQTRWVCVVVVAIGGGGALLLLVWLYAVVVVEGLGVMAL